jgi:biotin synthase
MIEKIKKYTQRVISGSFLTEEEALLLISVKDENAFNALVDGSHAIFEHYCSNVADICSLVNAKSGACSEDCRFCAQSAHYNSRVHEYPLLDPEEIVKKAQEAELSGTHRFCIVTSGGRTTAREFELIVQAYRLIREKTSLALDGSLGLLTDDQIKKLKEVGVTRVNHNLESSERFFPNVCTTHSFRERYQTIQRLKAHGLEVCAGGIIGLGETESDRVSLALSLRELQVDSVPINILNPRPGTPFEKNVRLTVFDIIKTIAVFRFLLPDRVIKIAGGREVNLGDAQISALRAGANGIIIGGYLTTQGNSVEKDKHILSAAGLKVM